MTTASGNSARASGILLHPTSLPGHFGIGDFGDAAYRFIDFLDSAGQRLWQVLPLGPTDDAGSPYSAYSAFAGNLLLISPEKLSAAELLQAGDLESLPRARTERVDFAQAKRTKNEILRKAFARFRQMGDGELRGSFELFREEQASWLPDYALFQALKDAHDGKAWVDWEPAVAMREPAALARARTELRDEIEAQTFFQFLFFRQWHALKALCNQRGISIIGDLPMFIAHDSADVWANREQFKLDNAGKPTVVAGVPPDYFSETGQFWGNPLYNWERMRVDGFAWWIQRLRASFSLFDIVRLDHFRGFAACWEIPAGDNTAENGAWIETPGREFFSAAQNALGDLPIIAEDLGVITADVVELREEFGFPGMRVLQFGFSGEADNLNLPDNYDTDVVAYTGTHDNDTTIGWFAHISESNTPEDEKTRAFCLDYLKSDGRDINWDFIAAVEGSVATTAIVPLQDVLGLGSEARMNTPNTTSGNWSWRFQDDSLTASDAARLRYLTEQSKRVA